MFQIFRTPNIDFMKWRKVTFLISAMMILGSLAMLASHKSRTGFLLDYGIDFRGGSSFVVRFDQAPDIGVIRRSLGEEGFGTAAIQSYGDDSQNSVLVRVSEQLEDSSDLVARIRRALRPVAEAAKETAGLLDLNTADDEAIALLLESELTGEKAASRDPVYRQAGQEIIAARDGQASGRLTELGQVQDLPGVTAAMYDVLGKGTFLGTLVFLKTESVGPAVGDDLRRKALFASVVACVLILAYLSLRFELRFGVAAVCCLLHDVLVIVGVFALSDEMFDLTVLAAILTVIGYSVNDTIVVFDRIRTNVRLMRKQPLEDVINTSINQTLSRTIITSTATLLAVVALYVYGGEVLRGFALALLIGVVEGTYSSIFIASPLLLVWQKVSTSRA